MTPFEAKLAKRIDEELERLREQLESPAALKTFDEYKFISGQIFALKRVQTAYFDEVNEDLNKEK